MFPILFDGPGILVPSVPLPPPQAGLTKAQRQELIRILGFPALGRQASISLGYPGYASQFAQFQPYAWLEDRMTALDPGEQVQCFGLESPVFSSLFVAAMVGFVLSTPGAIASGATLSVTINGSNVEITTIAGDTPATVAVKVAEAVSGSSALNGFSVAAGGGVFQVSAVNAGYDGNGSAVTVLSSDPSLLVIPQVPANSFVAPIPGQLAYGVTVGGADPQGVKVKIASTAQPIWGFVPVIRILESDTINSRTFLFAQQADTFTPRPNEIAARKALCRELRLQLAGLLNAPLDIDLVGNRRRRMRRVI